MIIVRADANEYIGTGHVMRCLSIAKRFAHYGEKVLFVTADEIGNIVINQNGFESLCLHTDYRDMESELTAMLDIVDAKHPKLLLVDSYFVTARYFCSLSNVVKIAYVDDLNTEPWDIDYIINYNIFSEIFDYSYYDGLNTKLLLGTRYAPLRDEFQLMTPHNNSIPANILVSTGGADPECITVKIMQEVCPLFSSLQFHFVVGALNPELDTIKYEAKKSGNSVLHINTRKMSELMKNSDIAISAAGSTLYELCAVGVPTITYTLSDNQIIAAKEFDRQGIMINAGDIRGNALFVNEIKNKLQLLLKNNDLRKELSCKMQRLVDGHGANRIAEELLR